MIRLVVTPSIFSSTGRKIGHVETAETAGLLLARQGLEGRWHLIRHGHRIKPETPIEDGDEIIAIKVPAGPVLPIVVYAVVSAVVGAGIAYAINYLMGPTNSKVNAVNQPAADAQGGGSTYNWEGIVNTRTNGTGISVVIGEHRIGGQIIQLYRRNRVPSERTSYLYMLLCFGHGPYKKIGQYTDDRNHLTAHGSVADTFAAEGQDLVDDDKWEHLEGSTTSFTQTAGNLLYDGSTARFELRDLIGHNGDNIEIRATLGPQSGNRIIRCCFNMIDSANYHAFYRSGSNLIVIKRIGGTDTQLHSESGISTGDEVKIWRYQKNIHIEVNDTEVAIVDGSDVASAEAVGLHGTGSSGSSELEFYRARGHFFLPKGTQINNVDANTYNHVLGYLRHGADDQSSIGNDFKDIIQAYNPGVTIDQNWTEYIVHQDSAGFFIVIDFPRGLYDQTGGPLANATVTIEAMYSDDDGATWSGLPDTPYAFTHKITTPFSRTIFWDTAGLSDTTQRLRFRRQNRPGNDTDALLADSAVLGSIIEIEQEDAQRYLGFVLFALRIKATEQLQGSTPNVSAVVQGVKLPQYTGSLPVPAEPELDYSYSTNPAWAALFLLLNRKIGFGNNVGLHDIDLDQFRAWADWCDELLEYQQEDGEPLFTTNETEPVTAGAFAFVITDSTDAAEFAAQDFIKVQNEGINQIVTKLEVGDGTFRFTTVLAIGETYPEGWTLAKVNLGPVIEEKRHEFNGVFDGTLSKWDSLIRICRAGRAIPIKRGNKFSVRYESTGSPVQHIDESAMIEDTLEVTYIGGAEKADILEAQYLDAEQDYDHDTVTVGGFPPANLAKEPRKIPMNLYGITNRRHAIREAHYHLRASRLLKRKIKFESALDVFAAESGDIISVGATMPVWSLWTGRANGTLAELVLSHEITLAPSTTYQAMVREADNRSATVVTITEAAGTYPAGTAISTDGDLTEICDQPCTIGVATNIKRDYKITRVSITDDLTIAIDAVDYNPDIYALQGWEIGIVHEWPPEGICVGPGKTYRLNYADYPGFDTCGPPAGCGEDPGRQCCWTGDITVVVTGSGAGCVTIQSADIEGAIIVIEAGCEGLEICIEIVFDGSWCDFPDTCECGVTCGPACPGLETICDVTSDQICWTICDDEGMMQFNRISNSYLLPTI